ncbi:hypothetical protein [Micromonospora sp. ATA51]|uniref:hypothetical protein n=1 Tax=Micromonospora sp. ATA51 TaxID=2806098 RepID=UPI001A380A82|nr:hypothetical protein [Micromonospora sp. ATA51]MBM0229714.1 hypothetical protein [Micromonospora sp. ATA51]
MSRDAKVEEEAARVKAALPGYIDVRKTAAAVLAATAEDLGLELRERDARDLAEAVVDAIHKAAELRGIEFACTVADMEVAANERWLLAPAREKAKAHPEERKTLAYLEQFAQGVERVRNELVERLARVGRQWLAEQPGAVVALPAVAEARAKARAVA